MPEEIKPVEPVVEIPKTKEEWNKLNTENPTRWAELTQQRTDQVIRESRETKTRLEQAEQREKNLLAEMEALKQRNVQPIQNNDGTKNYGLGNYPQTEEEWNDLFLEKPTLATDLRNSYLNEKNTQQQNFVKSVEESAKTVMQEHPDMYILEINEDGSPKKDANGKNILKIDPTTGKPFFNANSDKGKLWDEIVRTGGNWDNIKNAPLVVMAEMERRLRTKGASMIKEQNKEVNDDSSGVAPRGVTPPPASSLKFESAEEKALAQKSVDRGTFKSLEEWVQWRDKPTVSYVEKDSRPVFK